METDIRNRHSILSAWIVLCGLIYIFAYQFKLPFEAEVCLYGMLIGLIAMALLDKYLLITHQVIIFALVAISSVAGALYTTMKSEGTREATLFVLFLGMFMLSLMNSAFVRLFVKWIYIISVVVVLSSILHYLVPEWFNALMKQIMRDEAYEQLMWSFSVDNTFAGLSAYTPNTTFSAAIVFGNSFLALTNKEALFGGKSKLINIALLMCSLFSIVICSKRGVFVATIVALVVLTFYMYRGMDFFLKFMGGVVLSVVVLIILYGTSEIAAAFFDRFTGDDLLTGRGEIYASLLSDFKGSNVLFGRGTASTYQIADVGAHNIYLQVLYDHGIILSVPYFAFFLYNYYLAFKNKCPISIFVETLFLVYGLSGNPLYSNMFMMIYIYFVLYAVDIPDLEELVVDVPMLDASSDSLPE